MIEEIQASEEEHADDLAELLDNFPETASAPTKPTTRKEGGGA